MKRFLPLFVLLGALLLGGCAKSWSDVKVTACKLTSVTPSGLRSLDAFVTLTIDNPARDLIIREANGMLKRNGEPFIRIKASDIFVEGRCTKDYKIPLSGYLEGEGGVLTLLSSFNSQDPADYTVDILALISLKSGIRHTFQYKDVPLEDILKMF